MITIVIYGHSGTLKSSVADEVLDALTDSDLQDVDVRVYTTNEEPPEEDLMDFEGEINL